MKAVLPVAGMGTRFLPLTKAVPKEMLPLVDRPCVAYVIAEAVESGASDIVLITARGKSSIEDYFDRSPALEAALEAAGKLSLANEIRAIARSAQVISLRQQETQGLGHAVLCAAPAISEQEDFAVLLPDDIIDHPVPALQQLLQAQPAKGTAILTLKEIPRERTNRYGICAGPIVGERLRRVDQMVEKPAPDQAPSTSCIVGRYVLPGRIFSILRQTPRGRGNEIQLTDAIAVLASEGQVYGYNFEGQHFDTGNPVGLLSASLHFACKHPLYGAETRELLKRYA